MHLSRNYLYHFLFLLSPSLTIAQDINTDMLAYTNHCKRELGFSNPKAKFPYLSCYDSGQIGTSESELLRESRQDGRPISASL